MIALKTARDFRELPFFEISGFFGIWIHKIGYLSLSDDEKFLPNRFVLKIIGQTVMPFLPIWLRRLFCRKSGKIAVSVRI